MNPLSLRATNLRKYPHLEWEIPEGVTAIIGPNGAGKSTLLGAIELALFAYGARDLAPAMGLHGERLEIVLTFAHADELFRVRRTYTAGGRGKATLDLEISTDGVAIWQPLTRESAAATQALIESTLGLTRATFNASAFLAQGNAGAFPEASPAERKALLGEILDPRHQWPHLAERATTERKALEAKQVGVQARIADRTEIAVHAHELSAAVSGRRDRRDHQASQEANAGRLLEEALAVLAANEAAAERMRAATQARLEAENRRDNAQDTYRAAQEQAALLPGAQARLVELAAISATVPELERNAEAQSRALGEVSVAKERSEAAKQHAAQLLQLCIVAYATREIQARRQGELIKQIGHLESAQDGTEHCALCDQMLGVEARATSLERLRAELESFTRTIVEHEGKIRWFEWEAKEAGDAADAITIPEADDADYSTPLAQARRAAEERAGLEVAVQGYKREADRLPALLEALADADAYLSVQAAVSARAAAEQQNGPALARSADSARAAQQAARASLDAAQADLVRAQESLARAEQAVTELAELQAQTAAANQRLDLLRLAERACGRDGIPALIAENTCNVIEAEANRVLERIPTASGTAFRVELRTQRVLKGDASAMRETLDILVSDRQQQREYLTFSGGEQWRVSFALRWALARLLAGRRGAESRLLVIDEPDGLDSGGMDGLAAVLREDRGGFEKILVVSHSPLLATAFEQVVEVESDGEVSRLVAPRAEAVPPAKPPDSLLEALNALESSGFTVDETAS